MSSGREIWDDLPLISSPGGLCDQLELHHMSEERITSEKNCDHNLPMPKLDGCNFTALGESLKGLLGEGQQYHRCGTSHNILICLIKSACLHGLFVQQMIMGETLQERYIYYQSAN